MRPRISVASAIVVGAISLFNTSSALANGASEPQCVTQPATVSYVETTNSSSNSTTHIHVEVKKNVDEQVRQFEKAHKVIVAIRQKSNGVKSSKHCKDPVKAGWLKPGDPFTNTRHDKSQFTAPWQNGRKICNFKIIHRGGKTIAKGEKDDCGNTGIEIVIHGQKPKPQTQQIIEFKTVREFRSVYDKWITVTNQSSSTDTGSFTMQYTCAAGWDLIEDSWGNHLCRKCEQKPQPPVSPTQPVVSTTQINDVETGQFSANFRVGYQIPAGHTATMVITPSFGKMSPSDGPTTGVKTYRGLTGSDAVTLTYFAPSEVPQGNSDVPAGKDKILVTLVDDDGVPAPPSWQLFTIVATHSGGGCC
jgi:hypothetical protein